MGAVGGCGGGGGRRAEGGPGDRGLPVPSRSQAPGSAEGRARGRSKSGQAPRAAERRRPGWHRDSPVLRTPARCPARGRHGLAVKPQRVSVWAGWHLPSAASPRGRAPGTRATLAAGGRGARPAWPAAPLLAVRGSPEAGSPGAPIPGCHTTGSEIRAVTGVVCLLLPSLLPVKPQSLGHCGCSVNTAFYTETSRWINAALGVMEGSRWVSWSEEHGSEKTELVLEKAGYLPAL